MLADVSSAGDASSGHLAASAGSTLVALLGPTNTGKTHRAIERMLEHDSGMIGLPLRLLAREVYDKLTTRVGEAQVALITGEEKRIPRHPRYWVSTVEAMPVGRDSHNRGALEVDFIAVDEIQLAAHPERGHVFTERLLHARGRQETWFMGAETMKGIVERLLPTARIASSPRLSRLVAVPSTTLAQTRKRSAIVAFSLARVYELGERVRARRGGAAIVVGALSPRARNAQVALYQSGEVDYMVATDAIGMGLNLDIDHVSFADVRKFDGREARDLDPAEIGQIAGRAGRHTRDGTFGTLAPLPSFSEGLARNIEEHRFPAVRTLIWRNSDVDFVTLDSLAASLDAPPPSRLLRRVERAEDRAALEALRADRDWSRRLRGEAAVTLAWDVCRIPDYRKLLFEDHVATLKSVLGELTGPGGHISAAFMSSKLEPLAKPAVDIDGLMAQIASVRTWSYVANQTDWVREAGSFQARALEIENTLADALHELLVARFVDRSRAARIPAAAKSAPDSRPGGKRENASPFAALANLRLVGSSGAPEVVSPRRLIEELAAAEHSELVLEPSCIVRFGGEPVGKLIPGRDLLTPDVVVTAELSPSERLRAHRRLVAFTRDVVEELSSELSVARPALSPAGRGLLHVLGQSLGSILSADVRAELHLLGDDDRSALSKAGIVLGAWTIYVPRLLKPPATNLRRALASARLEPRVRVRWPESAAVSALPQRGVDRSLYAAVGFPWWRRARCAPTCSSVWRAVSRARHPRTATDCPWRVGSDASSTRSTRSSLPRAVVSPNRLLHPPRPA